MGRDSNMKFQVAVLGATGFIGTPYRQEIRECPEDASIVSLCGRRIENLKAAAREDGDGRRARERVVVGRLLEAPVRLLVGVGERAVARVVEIDVRERDGRVGVREQRRGRVQF